ncbi:glucose-6-phosphatase a, catalytic subunit, tandem duplicate 1 [Brachionichthys hirsutus]|uniref:glucose-6-phosphatase a, catalytic subunit, tandem duplicate 1 n=1 Tax=Brachionichthys hirsutus TaxID=412623 RepID=UPI0036048E98
MDLLHSWGVELLVYLQKNYSQCEDFFGLATTVGDLRFTFFYFFPVWFFLRRETALRLVWVAVIGDWLNMLLKWVLFGERPYWWVRETGFYGDGPFPALVQFPITCETGPGSPSGHAMAVAGVWFVMVTSLLTMAAENNCPPTLYRFLQVGLWMLVGLMELVVCMSRLYILAHFPHQVIAGAIIGLLVAAVVSKGKWIYNASMQKYFFAIAFLTSFALCLDLLLRAMGMDMLWSMAKAQKWCVRPDWVHLDSMPFSSFVRNMGALFGLALGLHSPLHAGTKMKSAGASFKLGCVISSVILLQLLDFWTFSAGNHMKVTFYFLSFSKNAVAVLIPTALVPWALCWIFKGKKEHEKL